MEVVETVMTMSSILLLHATTGLVTLCPGRLHNLAARAPNTFSESKGVPILTVLLMVADMHLWDAVDNAVCHICNIREPLLETRDAIYTILAVDIVAVIDIGVFFVCSEYMCQSPVAICITE